MIDPTLMLFSSHLEAAIFFGGMLAFIIALSLIGYRQTKDKDEKKTAVTFLAVFGSLFVVALGITAVFANINTAAGAVPDSGKPVNTHRQYESPTSKEDCYICNESADLLLSFHWGENNVAIVDLNTFDFYIPQINRYSDDRQLIEKKAGFMNIGGKSFQTGERLHFYTESDRGSADGTIDLSENSRLAFDSVSSLLCADCLTGLMNRYTYEGAHWNIALLNLQDKTLRPLEESLGGFGLGDFSVRSRYDGEKNKIDLLVWYSPLRYE